MQPKVLILRSPGTNCEQETAYAFEMAGGRPQLVHINQLMERPELTREFQILCIPGGFSYGDDIAAGRILASQFQLHLRDFLEEFNATQKLVLGICNGFQVLIKTGMLVPPDQNGLPVTLTWNNNGHYTCQWVTLRTGQQHCVFLRDLGTIYLPIAHAEGRFVVRDAATLDSMAAAHQLALRYVNADGSNGEVPYPNNPNGSDDNIAGICDPTGCVFGLMPHPERYVEATQHPRWTREGLDRQPDGLKLFRNAIAYFA